MDIKAYISSGILELYVLGQLSPEEMTQVEDMQSKYVEIRKEIYDISISLEQYGRLTAIKAPDSIGQELFKNLPPKDIKNFGDETLKNQPDKGQGLQWNIVTTLFALISLLGFTLFFLKKMEHDSFKAKSEKDREVCDSIQLASQQQYALLIQINNPNNKILDLTPTAGYTDLAIYLHHNETDRINLLQLVRLPAISSDQAFQLWSLKDGVAPIPLDVFDGSGKILPVAYEDGTGTYAITIEPKGGSLTPTLEKLIATVGVI